MIVSMYPRHLVTGILLCTVGFTIPAHAGGQVLPSLPGGIGRTLGGVGDTLRPVERTLGEVQGLARAQVERVRDLARRFPEQVAIDPEGNAVRAGELVMLDPDDATVRAAQAKGFRLIETVDFAELGVGYARFAVPERLSLRRALSQLREVAGDRPVSTDPLHFTSGSLGETLNGGTVQSDGAGGVAIGIIDGGVSPATPGLAQQRGFARGGPRPHDHATAIASLLTGGRGVRPSAGGARLHVADVYGDDPAGGNATALGQALAWMVGQRVPVVVVSLVGPANPLLARIVAAARKRGTMVVAAVGNDGPAAPPAYPASYPQAIAVSGVDRRGRALIEAGRAGRLDYAAPGADLRAMGADGRMRVVRGTSFAAPFVAARLAANLGGGNLDAAVAAVNREAVRGGSGTGRGIVCGDCATR